MHYLQGNIVELAIGVLKDACLLESPAKTGSAGSTSGSAVSASESVTSSAVTFSAS